MLSGVFSILYDGSNIFPVDPVYADHVPLEFVAGPENGLLKAASEALSQKPRYNPILLFGITGVGKTHLLQLFSANYSAQDPTATVLLLNGAEFARGYTDAIELNAIDEFRSKHRHGDLFVLDDLHELAGRSAAQQELLHTIDTLIDRQTQILLASRACPAESDWILPGLSSRLSCGLTVPISKPSAETRRVLLAQIAAQKGIRLSARVADEILHDPNMESVAQLTSVLLELVNLDEQSPDEATMRRILESRTTRASLSPRQIIKQVARYFRIKSTKLVGASRRQSTVRARGAAIYLVRRLTGISFEQLGRHFGGRDHSTTLHAYRRTEATWQSDPLIRKAIHEVTQRLGAVELT